MTNNTSLSVLLLFLFHTVYGYGQHKEIIYNEDGRSGESTEYQYHPDGQVKAGKKLIFALDEQDRYIHEEWHTYNPEKETWTPSKKEICRYDKYGNKHYRETYNFDEDTGQWVGDDFYDRVYNQHRKYTTHRSMKWSDGKWAENRLVHYKYRKNSNKEILCEEYTWNPEVGEWEGKSKVTGRYDNQGNKTEHQVYQWQPDQRDWRADYKVDFIFRKKRSNQYKEEIQSYLTDGVWVPSRRFENVGSKNSGQKTSYRWKKEAQKWEANLIQKYSHSKEGVQTYEMYMPDSSTGEWIGEERTETFYDEIVNNNRDRWESYSLWNYQQMQWQYTWRYTLRHCPEKTKEFLFEKFNPSKKEWQNHRLVRTSTPEKLTATTEEYLWDEPSTSWVGHRKADKVYLSEEYDTDHTHYLFDATNREWVPHFLVQSRERYQKYIYLQWNPVTQQWDNHAIWYETERDEVDKIQLHLWEPSTQQWIGDETWNSLSYPRYMETTYFRIEKEIDYRKMIGENKKRKRLQDDFDERTKLNGGPDRTIGHWKVIDVHETPDSMNEQQEVDFLCSPGDTMILLRLRNREKEKLCSADNNFNGMLYWIAEVPFTEINDELIGQLLERFEQGGSDIEINDRLTF